MQYLLKRLTEPSTWQGIVSITTGFGVYLAPEMREAIISLGVAAFTLVSVFMKDRGSDDAKKQRLLLKASPTLCTEGG